VTHVFEEDAHVRHGFFAGELLVHVGLDGELLHIAVIANFHDRREGLDPLAGRRAVVARSRKLVLLACAGVRSGWVGRDLVQVPLLAAIAYLVDHCHAIAHDLAASEAAASAEVNGRVAWMLDLFDRLEVHKLEQRESAQGNRRQRSH
jgi:hypothetical protein